MGLSFVLQGDIGFFCTGCFEPLLLQQLPAASPGYAAPSKAYRQAIKNEGVLQVTHHGSCDFKEVS